MKTGEAWYSLKDPLTRADLSFVKVGERFDCGLMKDAFGESRWPVILGIPFLRASRRELADQVVERILKGAMVEALALLLSDTDDFAPSKPKHSDCLQIAGDWLSDSPQLAGKTVMERLAYGPVADYFSLRGLAPTYLSGVELLRYGHSFDRPLIEVGCGAGHFLYWLQSRGMETLGVDPVFSKLCLAARYILGAGDGLLCAEVGSSELPLDCNYAATVFCHDAFYFFEAKRTVMSEFRRLASEEGAVLIGHAHLASADHGAVAGYPLSLEDYKSIADPKAFFFDDGRFVSGHAGGPVFEESIPADAEAVSFIEGALLTGGDAPLRHNKELFHVPLDVEWLSSEKRTQIHWPSEAFAQEYCSAHYLESERNPFEALPIEDFEQDREHHEGLQLPAPFIRLSVKPLRWGIIGGGWIAQDYCAPAFQFIPHADLVALAEPSSERRQQFSSSKRLQLFADWQTMIDKADLDAVYLATPNDLHAAILEGFARSGIRVLCEKPVATNDADLDQIAAAISHHPENFQTAYDQRYHPAHQRIARLLEEGAIGTVTQARIHYACWLGDDWSKVADVDNWRIDRERAGGGAGFDLLPHCIDLLSYLCGESIDSGSLHYQHRVQPYAREGGVEDGALLSLATEGGILASLHVAYNCPEDQARRRIEIVGTEGRIEAENTMGQDPGGTLCFLIKGEEERIQFSEDAVQGPFVRQLDAVSRLWLTGRSPRFPFQSDLELARKLVGWDAAARLKPEPTTQA